ncbi:C2H2 type zinc finger domain protein, partial [Aureobasidium melanogenum]
MGDREGVQGETTLWSAGEDGQELTSRLAGPGAKKFKCRQQGCPYSFAKSEHRKRHERTHSGCKPFACAACGRQFARKDSLTRHLRLHAPSEDGSIATDGPLHEDSIAADDDDSTRPTAPVRIDVALDHGQDSTGGSWAPANMFTDTPLSIDPLWEEIFQQFQADPTLARVVTPFMTAAPPVPPVGEYDAAAIAQPHVQHSCELVIQHALSSLNTTIRSLPSDLATAWGPQGESRLALEMRDCLDIFLSRFSRILPIVHEPTFDPSQTAPSTLLLMLALGSGLLASNAAVSRAESLWSLAHAGAITSWPTMLSSQGSYDPCPGVQLVLTAAFGQIYAILSSNIRLRTTAQVVHPLGFHWARQSCMYNYHYNFDMTPQNDPSVPLDTTWRKWAAAEVQLRAVLALYILDGQIAQLSGTCTCVRHSINALPMPSTRAVFAAPDATTWKTEMSRSMTVKSNFRDFISALYKNESVLPGMQHVSPFAIRVVLESFQSFASERLDAGGDAIGSPSQQDTADAMIRLYRACIQGSEQQDDLALRWHSILGFSMFTDIHMLCGQLCTRYSVSQQLCMSNITNPSREAWPEIEPWTESYGGRVTLIHSLLISDKLKSLASEFATGMHLPLCIFSAAVVVLAYLSAGRDSIAVPDVIDWQTSDEICTGDFGDHSEATIRSRTETLRFCNNITDDGWKLRRLRVELQGLRVQLRILGTTWGVCEPMEATLDLLTKAVL